MKGVKFEEFIKNRDNAFRDSYLVANLEMLDGFINDEYFPIATASLISGAVAKLGGYEEESIAEFMLDEAERDKKFNINKIIDFLSFKTEKEVHTTLPVQFRLKNDYFYNSLNYTFYALTILDKKIQERYEVVYRLHQNKVSWGCAGYSEKLKCNIPFFFTYLDKILVCVDAIRGRIETVNFEEKIEEVKIENGILYVNGEEVIKMVKKTYLVFLKPVEERQRDYRQAERAAKRAKGSKVKETNWETIYLGKLRGSNKNLKSHLVVALMVYGIEVVKYAVMEGHSWMTVDHINAEHNDNRVDNLALLTRKNNNSKGDSQDDTYYFDYFLYLSGCPLEKCS